MRTSGAAASERTAQPQRRGRNWAWGWSRAVPDAATAKLRAAKTWPQEKHPCFGRQDAWQQGAQCCLFRASEPQQDNDGQKGVGNPVSLSRRTGDEGHDHKHREHDAIEAGKGGHAGPP